MPLWLDANNDGEIDLLWVGMKGFWLYIKQDETFEPKLISSNPGGRKGKLTLSDYDLDGDLDVFLASAWGNFLFNNTENYYTLVKPKSVGLPVKSLTANWVDYNNDGLPDLHVVPDGLYRQLPDHRFKKTHLLETKSPALTVEAEARSTWFDADNDGLVDLLMAVRYRTSWLGKIFHHEIDSKEWTLRLYKNNTRDTNHWLQIKLIGSASNRQAIGAKVKLVTPDGIQYQQVGQFEGSHYSQGHYRLYFGLRSNETVDSVEILWSDANEQKISNVAGDQLLIIEQEAG